MNEGPITVRYAKALFNLAEEQHVSDHVYTDVSLVEQTLRENHELGSFIENPIIPAVKKNEVLQAIFKDYRSPLTISLFELVVHNKREKFLGPVSRMFIKYYRSKKNIRNVEFISAKGISSGLRTNVLNLVKKIYESEIELTEKTDEKLIGGFILRVEDMQYDASIADQLNKIKQELLDSSV